MKREEKYRKVFLTGSRVLFGIYLILLTYFLFFAESTGRTCQGRSYHYNLILFREIRRFLRYWKSLGAGAVLLNLLGNVAAFVPFGFLLPMLRDGSRSFVRVALFTFECSLAIELIQLICRVGSFDVDDLLLNTVGGMLGYLVFAVARRMRRKSHEKAS